MKNKLDKMIFEAAMELLQEQEDDKKDDKKKDAGKAANKDKTSTKSKIYAIGSRGRGRFSNEINLSASRAETDALALTKELGILGAKGDTDLDMAVSILNQAITNNEIMESAFPKIVRATVFNKRLKKTDGFAVEYSKKELRYREAAKYIYITLRAAENSGKLKMKKGIGFSNHQHVNLPSLYQL
jgi:hypothetical protein|tara:strand:+ start:2022 stop:2576 length:555 start_codon:yes stop_codon:yes gene_type:complete